MGGHCGDVCRMRPGRRSVAPALPRPGRPRAAGARADDRPSERKATIRALLRNLIASAPEAVVEHQTPIASGGLDELDRRREAIDNYGGNSMLSRRGKTTGPDQSSRADGRRRQPSHGDGGLRQSLPRRRQSPPVFPRRPAATGRLEGIAVGLGAVLLPSPVLGKVGGHRPPDQHDGAADRRRGHGDVRPDGRDDPLAGDRQPQRNQFAAARVRAGARACWWRCRWPT